MKRKRQPGKVWLVGAGPGDPGLITVRGKEVLARGEVILYDHLVHPSLIPPPSRRRLIPVGKRGGRGFPQKSIDRLMVKYAHLGKQVVRLKGGDPFVLGRGGEEVLMLRKAGIDCEVIPGLSSATSVPTLAGIPLTHRGMSSSFTVVTGHLAENSADDEPNWDLLARGTDTLVILMGVATFQRIAERLIRAGKSGSTPVAVIRWGSWPTEQRWFGTLADSAAGRLPVKTPSIIVVGNVVALATRSALRAKLPLAGVRVAVTREREYPDPLMAALEAAGAYISETPVIRSRDQYWWLSEQARERKYGHLRSTVPRYDWIVFTSARAVSALDELGAMLDIPRRDFLQARLAAIGPATAGDVESYFSKPDVVSKDARQEGVVKAVGAVDGKRILFPCAVGARKTLPETLRQKGATVDVLPLYDMKPEQGGIRRLRDLVSADGVDVVTFTSGSTVRNALTAVGPSGRRKLRKRTLLAASIGPVTSAELRKSGIRPSIQAVRPSMEGLAAAIVRYYRKHPHARP